MAGHYGDRALRLKLPAASKLVLFAIADSANTDNREGHPGMDTICDWSGLKKSRASEVINELIQLGYLVRLRPGVKGRRAEYVVFPHGCCPEHAPLPGYSAELPSRPTDSSAPPEESGRADSSAPPDASGDSSAPPEESDGIRPVKGPAKGPVQTGPRLNVGTRDTPGSSTELTYPGPEQDQDDTPPLAEGGGGPASPAPWGTTSPPGLVGSRGYAEFREALAALPVPKPVPPKRRRDTAPATGAV